MTHRDAVAVNETSPNPPDPSGSLYPKFSTCRALGCAGRGSGAVGSSRRTGVSSTRRSRRIYGADSVKRVSTVGRLDSASATIRT